MSLSMISFTVTMRKHDYFLHQISHFRSVTFKNLNGLNIQVEQDIKVSKSTAKCGTMKLRDDCLRVLTVKS